MIEVCDDWPFEKKLDAWMAAHNGIARQTLMSAVRASTLNEQEHEAKVPARCTIGAQYRATQDAIRIGLAERTTALGFILTPQSYHAACCMAS